MAHIFLNKNVRSVESFIRPSLRVLFEYFFNCVIFQSNRRELFKIIELSSKNIRIYTETLSKMSKTTSSPVTGKFGLFVPFNFFSIRNVLCYPGSVDRKDRNTKRETMASSVENAISRFHKTLVPFLFSIPLCSLLYSFEADRHTTRISESAQPEWTLFGRRKDGQTKGR